MNIVKKFGNPLRWWCKTDYDPMPDGIRYFAPCDSEAAMAIEAVLPEANINVEYIIDLKIGFCCHGPYCTPLWPNKDHFECGGTGNIACLDV